MGSEQKCLHRCEILPCIVHNYKGNRSTIRSLCFHPNTETLYSGNDEGYIMSWNYNDAKPRSYRFDGHTGSVNDISLSSIGDLMISASNDSTVRMWVPIATGEVTLMKAHKSSVRSVCFNPVDSSMFATCSSDKSIKIWAIQNFKASKKEKKVKTYDFLHSFRDHKNWVNSVRFSPDGSLLCSASDDKTVKIFDARQRKCAISIDNPLGRSLYAEFNPCGSSYVAVSTESRDRTYPSPLIIFDVRAKSPLQLYKNLFASTINHFAFHPSGDFLVCVSEDAKIKVLDLHEARPLYTLYAAREAINKIAFTPNGCLFATGGKDTEILLWEHSMMAYKDQEGEEFEGESYNQSQSQSTDRIQQQDFGKNSLQSEMIREFEGEAVESLYGPIALKPQSSPKYDMSSTATGST